jgi:hypothetical protein
VRARAVGVKVPTAGARRGAEVQTTGTRNQGSAILSQTIGGAAADGGDESRAPTVPSPAVGGAATRSQRELNRMA